MMKESCNLIGRDDSSADNFKVYVIHEEMTLWLPWISVRNKSRQVWLWLGIPGHTQLTVGALDAILPWYLFLVLSQISS